MTERRFESGRTFGYRESMGNIEISYEAGIRIWNDNGEMVASVAERADTDVWLYVLYNVIAALHEARAAQNRGPYE